MNRDLTGIPSSALGTTGQVVLGYLDNGSSNEHLMIGEQVPYETVRDLLTIAIDSPLAQGFKYSDSKVTFTVPSVPSRTDYIVVRM